MGKIEFTAELKKHEGMDATYVEIPFDVEDKAIDIPAELKTLFIQHPNEESFFNSLSYTNRKEYYRWITEARKAETRLARLGRVIGMLGSEKRNPSEK